MDDVKTSVIVTAGATSHGVCVHHHDFPEVRAEGQNPKEAAAITATLMARRDPAYEWGMWRTVPSQQPAHATRVPDIRKTASELRRTHRGVDAQDVLDLCDGLWATQYREERIVAISLAGGTKEVLEAVTWNKVERWSRDIDNWEHVDHLAKIAH